MMPCNLRSLLLAAIVLSNCIAWTASRHHYTHNVSGHRSRHRRQGAGLYLSASYVLPGGEGAGWGEWGEVSPCSRTCGGGVASQKRICLKIGPDGQPQCTGGDTKYFSCETQDCPAGSRDFRAQQCSEFDDQSFRDVKYKWVPYTKSSNPCELNCMPHGERFYYRHRTKVVDGTRCNDESFDVCVSGTCQPVGCDMMLGSNAREDKCRECRGNGANCHTTTGLLDTQDLRKGYNDILLIPESATNIVIEEIAPSNNYLALRAKNGTYYLNGHYHIDFPRTLTIAGTLWTYERSQQGFAAPDKLRCLGPTNEPLYLTLLLQDVNVGINYEYSLPNELAPRQNKQYNWAHEEFTPCSAACGGGYQTRNVSCRSREELELVDDSLCDVEIKPPTNQSCNTDPCGAQWTPGPWGKCSKRCGMGGTMSREVHCTQIIANGYPSIVADKNCFDLYGPKQLFQECNTNATCPLWFTGPWKPCDKLCDEGKQMRQVVCYQKKGRRVEVLADEDCDDEKPIAEQKCMLQPCEGVDWVVTKWSGCDTCFSTVRTREVSCATKERKVVNDSFCGNHAVPETQQPCNKAELPPCEVHWYATQWSKCSVDCGKGIQTRNVFCGLFNGTAVLKVDDDRCAAEPKYNDTKECEIAKEKCPSKWFTGPWTECTEVCGGGEQYRQVMCLSGEETASDCNESDIPDSTQSCNSEPCRKDKSTTVSDDYEDCIEEEDYPEVGLDAVTALGSPTIDDTMFSDSTPEGSGDVSISPAEMESTFSTDFTLALDEFITTNTGGSTDSDITETDEDSTDETTDDGTASTSGYESTTELDTESTESTITDETESTTPESSSASNSTDTGSTEPTTTAASTAPGLPTLSASSGSTGPTTTAASTAPGPPTLSASSETPEYEATDETATTMSESDETESTIEVTTEFVSTESEGTTESEPTSGDTEEPTDSTGNTESTEITDSESTEPSVTTETGSTLTETGSSKSIETTETSITESTETTETDNTESTATTEIGSTESTETSDTDITESTETTEIGSTESTISTDSDSTEATETTESGSTYLTETTETGSAKTTEVIETGSTETTEPTETGRTETTESGSTKPTETDSTESTETKEIVSTETTETTEASSTVSTETDRTESTATTETGDTESTETTKTDRTESTETTETGSTKPTETTETASTEPTETTETGSTETTETTETGSTETTEATETGSTETTETTETGTTEPTETSGTSSTETSENGSTESTLLEGTTTEISNEEGSTASSEGTESSSESSTTEAATSTENRTPWDLSSTVEVYTSKGKRVCKPKSCLHSRFGCCPDKKTPALGPFDESCPKPHTCKESVFRCCPDGLSPAQGPKNKGCPIEPCAETLFGCCESDNKTAAQGNDQEGCPPPPPACQASKYGCCKDGETEPTGPGKEGCPETTEIQQLFTTEEFLTTFPTTEAVEGCAGSEYGCCFDNETAATGPDRQGCPCSTSEFGCCPDDVAPAQGPALEGCVKSCNTSAYGCCPDNKTPAHGIDNEGCCLLYAFGCCPDNFRPADGPHLEGCGCQFSRFGCCPDNITVATGPDNKGCGCQYTQFGCCPDRHSDASGPNFEGCMCHTYQFGCCPDGVTIARGSNGQGCYCQQTEFGCCGDEQTHAKGRNKEGCDCATSKYGCCLDGTTEATGPKFEGCSEKPVNKQAACALNFEQGPCRNYSVNWYYDTEYGGCSRFWYGGCDGNGNNFSGKDECDDTCVSPPPKDACKLPQVKGPCLGYNVRWYFDNERGSCSNFIYGGCLGNNNNFETRELCQAQCEPEKTTDQCKLSIERGSCSGSFPRWGYNKETGLCEEFIWSGCEGNSNRFSTEAACLLRCHPPGVPQPQCSEPQDAGNCTDIEALWSFSESENRCVPFYYTGCGGNENRFRNREDCQEICPSAFVPELCTLPAALGDCSNYREKWYFDTKDQRCRLFYYGGCGGNGNNFNSEQECAARCSPPPATTTAVPQATAATVSAPPPGLTTQPEICFMAIDAGPCNQMEQKWGYDYTTGKCIAFQYGGCGGNQNHFLSEEHCASYCKPVQDICQLPMLSGPCDASVMRWFYDVSTDSCSQFTYGGCDGNENRFESREQCESRCRTGPSSTTPAPTTTVTVETLPPECKISSELEPCRRESAGEVWYRDPMSNLCAPHQNLESGTECRITGSFYSQEFCERSCGVFRNIDVCRYVVDPGPCRAYLPKYQYNATSRRCEEFAYGGCLGGPNRFSTQQECQQTCMSTVDPCTLTPEPGNCLDRIELWYYDQSRDQCHQFAYGGCGGNENKFDTRELCERQCRKQPPPVVTTTTPLPLPTTGQPTTQEQCRMPNSLEPCGSNITAFYFDERTSSCQVADIGGCEQANNFRSEEECERNCGAFREIDVCQYRLDPGPCKASISKFYFDATSGSCRQFAYGGCLGGPNRFSTSDECQAVCSTAGPAAECLQEVDVGSQCDAVPVRRWHYDVARADCLVFAYQGCAGNQNNFHSYEHCAALCRVNISPESRICNQYAEECTSLEVSCPYGVSTAVAAEGCERCSCKESVDCEPLRRECHMLRCAYGVQRSATYDGCEKCTCNEDPCLTNDCKLNERCTVVASDNLDPTTQERQYSTQCVPESEESRICARYAEECTSLEASCPYGVSTAVAAEGCERCSCKESVDCEPLRRECHMLRCAYGVQRSATYDGCEKCTCNEDPCLRNNCTLNERCTVVASDYVDQTTQERLYSAQCVPEIPQAPEPSTAETEPQVVAVAGGTATLRCIFHGNPPPKVTWRFGEITIDGDKHRYRLLSDGALEIVSLDRTDSGVYICVAENEFGTAQQQVTLQVDEIPQAPEVSPNTEPQVAAVEGGTATLRCIFHGNPPPKVTWRFGEITIDSDKNRYRLRSDGALEIVSLVRTDSGVYICVAENELGTAQQEVTLTVKGEESNEVVPNCEALIDECARISCPYGVQRTRTSDGCERCACVPEEVDCTPLRRECDQLRCHYGIVKSVADDGCERCKCLVHPCSGKVCPEGERCVSTPFRDPITNEQRFSTECRIESKPGYCPPAEAAWTSTESGCRRQCNDDADCRGVLKCCARGCSQLCLPPAAPTTTTTTTAPLDIPQSPQPSSETEPEVSVGEGGKATLRCIFHGNPPPKITWRFGEITIDGEKDRYRLLSDGALEIVSLVRTDSGVYICVAENELGTAQQEVTLTVKDPVAVPTGIAGEPGAASIGELEHPIAVRCLAYGYPPPAIYWYRGHGGPMVPISNALYEYGRQGQELLIRQLTVDTLGEYECQAYNGVDKPVTMRFVVQAYRPYDGFDPGNPYLVSRRDKVVAVTPRVQTTDVTMPIYTTHTTPQQELIIPPYNVRVQTRLLPASTRVTVGAQLNLPCEVDGYPEPKVHWTKDNVVLANSDRMWITDSRLTISNVAVTDSGEYACHAANEYSSHSSAVQISVQDVYVPAKCVDNPTFANCALIVQSRFCVHKYYSKFCCKSCVEAGQLNPRDAEMQADEPFRKK